MMNQRILRGLMVLWVTIASFFTSASLHSDQVLVIGDSWAAPVGVQLRNVLAEQGHADISVVNTPYWGGPRNLDSPEGRAAISGWLEQYPDANIIYLMMGQNNWLCCWTTAMIGTQEETDLFQSIIDHMENVVNEILSLRPEARLVWTAGEYLRPHHLGTPTEMNANYDRLQELAVAFAEDKPYLEFIDWNGLLQVAYGFNGVPYTEYDPDYVIPPGDPSLPDPTLPSPQVAFQNAAHPNNAGYKTMAQEVYDRYLDALLNGPEFQINAGMNDAWFDPATNGQGFFIIVFESIPLVMLSWFTYDTERPPQEVTAILGEPGHRWITAQGGFEGATADLTVYLSSGGVFDSSVPAVGPPEDIGTMTVTFTDCNSGLVTYDIPSLGLSGSVPIQRLAPDNIVLCEALQLGQ